MTEETRKSTQGKAGMAVLAVAVLVALGVGFWLFLSGGSGESQTPQTAVRDLYRAVNDGNNEKFTELLAPAVNDDVTRPTIPFQQTLGAYDVSSGKAKVQDLQTELVSNEAGWALVSAKGKVTVDGQEQPLAETLYLQQSGNKWLVSNQATFLGNFGSGKPTPPPLAAGLGVIDNSRPDIGQPAPDFALIDARDGTTVRKLSDFRGKAVVVNWYASWCGPCKEEIPEFQAAQDALGDQVVFLGVNYQEDRQKAAGILDETGGRFPAVLDSDGSVAKHYRVSSGLPATFFVDANGVLQAVRIGQVHPDILEANLAKVGLTYKAEK